MRRLCFAQMCRSPCAKAIRCCCTDMTLIRRGAGGIIFEDMIDSTGAGPVSVSTTRPSAQRGGGTRVNSISFPDAPKTDAALALSKFEFRNCISSFHNVEARFCVFGLVEHGMEVLVIHKNIMIG